MRTGDIGDALVMEAFLIRVAGCSQCKYELIFFHSEFKQIFLVMVSW